MMRVPISMALVVIFSCGEGSQPLGPANPLPDALCHCIQICNPLTQTGCSAGHKCTWIVDQDDPPIGHTGCAPDGPLPPGDPCDLPMAGPMGYDDCAKGTACSHGQCLPICDLNGGAPTCDVNYSCAYQAGIFESGGTAIAGTCEPACDPLTQELRIGTTIAACGSSNPSMPDRACFGYDRFSCRPTTQASLVLTDRATPAVNVHGNPYLNSCAPGFIPLLFERTGSTKTLCTGFCAALEIDNTKPSSNAKGDASAPGKLPTQTTAMPGNATCESGVKGSHASSQCRFLWPYLVDEATNELPVAFDNGPHRDTLGVCIAIDFYSYDSNNDMLPDAPYLDCTMLPPRSSATPGKYDDAADWGCQLRANTTGGATRGSIRTPLRREADVIRHSVE